MAAPKERKIGKIINSLSSNKQNTVLTYTSEQEIDLQLSLGGSYNKKPIQNPKPQPFLGIPFAKSGMVPISYLDTSNVTYKEHEEIKIPRIYENEQRQSAMIIKEHRIAPTATNNPVYVESTPPNNREKEGNSMKSKGIVLSSHENVIPEGNYGEKPMKKAKYFDNYGVILMDANYLLKTMPSVKTSINGKQTEGILYSFGKDKQVSIVCCCHGMFFTPAEFVKHNGGEEVDNPMKFIKVITEEKVNVAAESLVGHFFNCHL